MAKKRWTMLAMSREGRVGAGLGVIGLAGVGIVPAAAALGWFQFNRIDDIGIFFGSAVVALFGSGLVVHAYARPDRSDKAVAPSYSPLDYAEANNFVAQRNGHHAQLRNGLGLIPSGKPDFPSIWGDLSEHLSGEEFADVWQMESRFRELVPLVRAETAKALDYLYDERRKVGHDFHMLTGSQSVLNSRVYAVVDGIDAEYPSNLWMTEPSFGKTLLKFGLEYGTAYVESDADEEAVKAAQRQIWDAIPTWPEVKAAREAQRELTQLRPRLQARLAEIGAMPSFPGHCEHCPRPPTHPPSASASGSR